LQDDSGGSEDEHRGAPTRSIREDIGRVEYQGEQVYRTSAHNALASRMLIDYITPHLPKDNEKSKKPSGPFLGLIVMSH
jgi:hypothetical protein